MQKRNLILRTVLMIMLPVGFVRADTKAMNQTTLGAQSRACPTTSKVEKALNSSARDRARLLKPVFASLAKQLSESPLQSLCDQMPNFTCWPEGHFPPGQIEIFDSGRGKVLIRVPCTMSAYNQTSFFVSASLGPQTPIASTTVKKKSAPLKKQLAMPPMLLMFPTHPDFQTVPQLQALGLKPLESIIGHRDFEQKKRRLTAYTKGLGDGSLGHFHQYVVPLETMIPKLEISIAKTVEDRKDPYHYERGQLPPFVKTWVRMRAMKASYGCLADFQDLQCRVLKK